MLVGVLRDTFESVTDVGRGVKGNVWWWCSRTQVTRWANVDMGVQGNV